MVTSYGMQAGTQLTVSGTSADVPAGVNDSAVQMVACLKQGPAYL